MSSTAIDAYEGDTLVHSPCLRHSDTAELLMIAASPGQHRRPLHRPRAHGAFYGDVLGLPLRLPYVRGEGWAGLQAGDVMIYLIEVGGDAAPPARRASPAPGPAGDRLLRLRGGRLETRSPSSTGGRRVGRRDRRVRAGTATAPSRPRGQRPVPDRAAARPSDRPCPPRTSAGHVIDCDVHAVVAADRRRSSPTSTRTGARSSPRRSSRARPTTASAEPGASSLRADLAPGDGAAPGRDLAALRAAGARPLGASWRS